MKHQDQFDSSALPLSVDGTHRQFHTAGGKVNSTSFPFSKERIGSNQKLTAGAIICQNVEGKGPGQRSSGSRGGVHSYTSKAFLKVFASFT